MNIEDTLQLDFETQDLLRRCAIALEKIEKTLQYIARPEIDAANREIIDQVLEAHK